MTVSTTPEPPLARRRRLVLGGALMVFSAAAGVAFLLADPAVNQPAPAATPAPTPDSSDEGPADDLAAAGLDVNTVVPGPRDPFEQLAVASDPAADEASETGGGDAVDGGQSPGADDPSHARDEAAASEEPANPNGPDATAPTSEHRVAGVTVRLRDVDADGANSRYATMDVDGKPTRLGEGQAVPGRFTVERISEDCVELAHDQGRSRLCLDDAAQK